MDTKTASQFSLALFLSVLTFALITLGPNVTRALALAALLLLIAAEYAVTNDVKHITPAQLWYARTVALLLLLLALAKYFFVAL